jgi:hypothetical protein
MIYIRYNGDYSVFLRYLHEKAAQVNGQYVSHHGDQILKIQSRMYSVLDYLTFNLGNGARAMVASEETCNAQNGLSLLTRTGGCS